MKARKIFEIFTTELTILVVPGGCPNEKCGSKRAYFYQLQTRSADEPPTSFYKVRRRFYSLGLEPDNELQCIECSKQWREY